MEKLIRAWLLQALGTERYLNWVSQIYIMLIKAGRMRSRYPELFFIKEMVKPGFVCIDIGANVGYYSTMLSACAGTSGAVHAVEPVQLFQRVFNRNMKRFGCHNVVLHPVALGGNEGTITMGTPMVDGVFRHGLTHVVESGEDTRNLHTYTVDMVTPSQLFATLSRLDFIKCDVEGYEMVLMPYFKPILERFKPSIQIELGSAEHRNGIYTLLKDLGYKPFRLSSGKLIGLSAAEVPLYDGGDFYFIATTHPHP